jgi:ATP-dependent DNA ligase
LIFVECGKVTIFSSNGNTYPGFASLKKRIEANYGQNDDFILDTELVFSDEEGKPLPRAITNGIANRSLNGSNTGEMEARAVFYVFDQATITAIMDGDDTPYPKRTDHLTETMRDLSSIVELKQVPMTVCHAREEVDALYESAVLARKEGIMVKTLNHPYENKRSKHWCKLKREVEVDVEVIGVTPHKKKEGHIGSLIVTTSDGMITGGVGSGLSDEDRLMPPEHFIGSIQTCRIHDVSEKKGQFSFYLPRIVESRKDKQEADDSAKIFSMLGL